MVGIGCVIGSPRTGYPDGGTMRFAKYHALGNDYLVLEASEWPSLDAAAVRRICDRHRGVGSDGLLIRKEGERHAVGQLVCREESGVDNLSPVRHRHAAQRPGDDVHAVARADEVFLDHVDKEGRAQMVDVSAKQATAREARAEGEIVMSLETLKAIETNVLAKGDVLTVAQLAGVMAAKRTAELIPLCHPLPLTDVRVSLKPDPNVPGVRCEATVRTIAQELASEGWLFRYRMDDGLGVPSVAFVICSFWLIEALVAIGRLDEARALMERVLAAMSPLGLLSEDYDVSSRRMWGNFPQAYSHVGLIHAEFAASPRWSEIL